MTQTGFDLTESLNVVLVGHVDHGKSTLLGRLYADLGAVPDGKMEKVRSICQQQGKEFEFAFLVDTFLEEHEQGVTIDVARTFLSWNGRRYVILDAPGHKEFLKNMVSGATRAQAALLLIDAAEGVKEQSRRHGQLLSLLGVRQAAVIVNKMDLVGYRQSVFDDIVAEYGDFLTSIGAPPMGFVPASARFGDNIAQPSPRMPWHTGPTALSTLERFDQDASRDILPLRFPVQDVYKFDDRRIVAGRIASGRLAVGERLVFWPSSKSARVRSVEAFSVAAPPREAVAGQSIGITLDEPIFVERGEIASVASAPPAVASRFRCRLFWMGKRPLETGRWYLLRLSTREVACAVAEIHRVIDVGDLSAQETPTRVQRNEVADLTLHTKRPVALDLHRDYDVTGRFVLVDQYDVAGGGIVTEILQDAHHDNSESGGRINGHHSGSRVDPEMRAAQYGHGAAVVLVSSASQRTAVEFARDLEARLVAHGVHACLLEPEVLGGQASAGDAAESVQRRADVARLLLSAGLVVVCAVGAQHSADAHTIRTLLAPAAVISVAADPSLSGGEQGSGQPSPEQRLDEAVQRVVRRTRQKGAARRVPAGVAAP